MKPGMYLSPVALLTLAGCATTFHAGPPEGAVAVIAHRGASAYAPENTLAAFSKALDMGADWFELDCHLTKDGKLAVIHDADLKRVANEDPQVVPLSTLEALQQADVGAWKGAEFAGERIPSLEQALDFAKGKIGVYLEVKSDWPDAKLTEKLVVLAQDWQGDEASLRRTMMREIEAEGTRNLALTREILQAVKVRRMKDQVVLQSFSPVVCVIALAEAPELRTEFLGADDPEKPGQWERFVMFGSRIGVAGLNVSKDSVTAERIAAFHAAGKTSAAWTVDDPAEMARCVDCGVDALITNRPDLCIETLRALGKYPERGRT